MLTIAGGVFLGIIGAIILLALLPWLLGVASVIFIIAATITKALVPPLISWSISHRRGLTIAGVACCAISTAVIFIPFVGGVILTLLLVALVIEWISPPTLARILRLTTQPHPHNES